MVSPKFILRVLLAIIFGIFFGINHTQKIKAQTIPAVSLSKSVDKTQTAPGEVLTYTITYTANNNVNSAVITEPIPARTSYEANSAKLNNKSKTDLQDSDEYYFDSANNKATWSLGNLSAGATGNVSFQVRIQLSLGAPTNLTATYVTPTYGVSPSQINLAWTDNSSAENYFKIEASCPSVGAPNFSLTGQVAADTTRYSKKIDLMGDHPTSCYYRVYASNSTGQSEYSNIAHVPVAILIPSSISPYQTNQSSIALAGEADLKGEITSLTWSNETNGTSGNTNLETLYSGETTYWNVENILLVSGSNTIKITASDNTGETGVATLTVNYNPNQVPIPVSDNGVPDFRKEVEPGILASLTPNGGGTMNSTLGVTMSFYDDSGHSSTVDLSFPRYTAIFLNGMYSFEYFSATQDLWLFPNGSGPLSVYHYKLSGTPLPTTATFVEELPFGNADSRFGEMIRLKSNALVAVWFQFTANADNSKNYGIAYLNPSSKTWTSIFPITVPPAYVGPLTSPSNVYLALVQHPTDDSIWVFANRDSSHTISALHLHETASGIAYDWAKADFISSDGENGPDGENPMLVAAPDPFRNQIDLAYVNENAPNFIDNIRAHSYIRAGLMSVAQIKADGTKTYLRLDVYNERVSNSALIPLSDGIYLAFVPLFQRTLNLYRYSNGSWSYPTILGQAKFNSFYMWSSTGVFINQRRKEFIANMGDDQVHVYTLQ